MHGDKEREMSPTVGKIPLCSLELSRGGLALALALASMYPLGELAEVVTTRTMVTAGACCTTWMAWPEGCWEMMEAGM